MDYNWNWGVLLQPVATGEDATYLGWIWHGFLVTVTLSVCAWLLALVAGTFFGILRTWPNRFGQVIGTAYVSIFRNVPLIVHFFIWYFVFPEVVPKAIGTWIKDAPPHAQFFVTSILALGFFTGARICEQVRAGVQSLAPGQTYAGLAIGLTLAQAYRYVICRRHSGASFRRSHPNS